MKKNIILNTDSYKLNHWNQYPKGTQHVYSYFESRTGAKFDYTEFFGLQAIIKNNLVGQVVTREGIEEAAALSATHFGNTKYFNREGWEHILNNHGGMLPIRIKAVKEGLRIPTSNILMSVEDTDKFEKSFWLTNALESQLTHVWYPSTVASLSREVKTIIKGYLEKTSDNQGGLNFMLHDFGYRGASSDETAAIGGAAHLVNFLGTDTVPAIKFIRDNYNLSNFNGIGYSVAATEHSVMTALGKDGEVDVIEQLLNEYPTGILSVVADSYDIYNFVGNLAGIRFKDRILARDGVFVIRPDSITPEHNTPESEMVWILSSLWHESFGGTVNSKGFKVINPKVRVLWGDGIDIDGISKILQAVKEAGFSVENIACFGMGGGLLQKVNRDIQRFAFKSSSQCRNDIWHDVYKSPKDLSKASKKGRLKLIKENGLYQTVAESDPRQDEMQVVFENGELKNEITFDEIRKNAEL